MAQTTSPDDVPEVLSATPARQGFRGVHVLWLLIISTVLAVLALFGAWAFRSPDLAAVETTKPEAVANAQQFDTAVTPPMQAETPAKR